jgi:hypothetical protein
VENEGRKTIEVTVAFWTNDHNEAKTCWDHGVVRVPANQRHGIKGTQKPTLFNSFEELGAVILTKLEEAEVRVVKSPNRKR